MATSVERCSVRTHGALRRAAKPTASIARARASIAEERKSEDFLQAYDRA
jgi:hypothetical protein